MLTGSRTMKEPAPPASGRAPEIGEKKTFIPGSWDETGAGDPRTYRQIGENCRVTGEVIYINAKHHFYRVRYGTATGEAQHECFKY